MSSEAPLTLILARFIALIEALRDGPLARPDLIARVGDAYPRTPSARPMIDRDVRHLAELGIVIEISRTRPPIYTLRGGTPVFDAADLRTLALVRETFGDRHPQAARVRVLLDRLTARLSDADRRAYQRRQALRAPLQPAIDYTPYNALIAELEDAIGRRQLVSFAYRPGGQAQATLHGKVEPYEIEFYERHFYLAGYCYDSRQTLDFRIDRIAGASFRRLDRLPPGMEHSRAPVVFRYRLAARLAHGELSQRFENQRVVERLPNGDVIIEAEGRSDFFIVQALLRYRANAELLEPARLRDLMAEEARAVAGLYWPGDPDR